MYIITMNQRNILIASIVLNVAFLIFFLMLKSNITSQAQEAVDKIKNREMQVIDNYLNNNLLWTIIDSTWKSEDKSKAFVKRFAESQKLPRCNGKKCTGTEDGATLKTIISDNAKDRSITVGWGNRKNEIKFFFKVVYDENGNFVTIDANDLLGKTSEPEPVEKTATDGE